MKAFRLLLVMAMGCIISLNTVGQGFSFNCTRDTTIPGCAPVCFTLKATIPDLHKQTNNYVVNPTSQVPGCFPVYVQPDDPAGTSASLTIDDRYSSVINMGFPFHYYGAVYNNLIASTNGYLSFDISKAGQFAHWSINTNPLPNNSYDKALIMGPYHDLNPNVSQPTQRIQYQLFGTAPHRRWILSFYKVPLFGTSCGGLFENTHQIILYESTGIIEISIFSKQVCTGWNSGRAIVGIQDFNRTQGMIAPGRGPTGTWGSMNMNESWRFTPSVGPSLYKRVELLDLAGNIVAVGTVTPSIPGSLEASFPNVCVQGGVSTYLVRSVYEKIDDPNTEIFGIDTIRVTRSTVVDALAVPTGTICSGSGDGSITVTPTAGTAPFTISLDGATGIISTGPYTYTNVSSGSHTLTVTDANNCTKQIIVTVTSGPPLVTTVTKTDALCNGSNTGSITVTPPTIGTPPYNYSLDSTTWQTSNVFNNLPAGTYTVYYASANGCPGRTVITINEPSSLGALATTTDASCDGGADGTITINATGGSPSYQYSLDGNNYQASNLFNVMPGTYTVYVKDNNGCINSFTTVVDLANNLSFSPQNDALICEGKSAQLSINSNATQYAWSPSTGLSSTSIYNPVASPTQTTQYIVKATLGICSIEDTVLVNVNPAPVPDAGPDGFICFGQVFQLNASGGTLYQWTPGTFLDNPNIPNPLSTPTKDWTYTLTILSDANGCASLTTDQIRIDVTPPIKVQTFPFDTVAHSGDNIQILAIPSDTDVIDYTWTPSTGLTDPKIANPVATAGAVGDVITYKVITSTIAGCRGEGFVTIRVYKGPDIYVPTGFTPNADGKNDRFTPFPIGMKSYNYFKVFNRWGQIVFSSNRLHDGWDGKLAGKEQPTGIYVWMIEGITKDDKIITKKGTVTLIR